MGNVFAPITFPDQVFWDLRGDRRRADALRGLGAQLMARLKNENVYDYPQYTSRMCLDDGTSLQVWKNNNFYTITIDCPKARQERLEERPKLIPDLQPGQFFWVPGCVARYAASPSPASVMDDAVHWVNSIRGGALAGEVLRYRSGVSCIAREHSGLPAMQDMGEAGVIRDVGVYRLPGGVDSGMYLSRDHVPGNATFSFSCAFRLNESLEYDYSFDERGILNPVRSYYLKSSDRKKWTWDCPGSLSPVIGWASPQYFTSDAELVTFPWAPWNDDFTHESLVTGFRAADNACSGAPRLADAWSVSSPYWDANDPPNPYPYPKGFITGMRFFGLFVYNGCQLLCGRLNDFMGQYQLSPIVTPGIGLGQWLHATVVQESDGVLNLYLANKTTKNGAHYSAMSLLDGMEPPTVYDAPYDYVFVGYNSWYVKLLTNAEKISHFSMNPRIDVCLPRFYGRSLTMAEAMLLHREALDGVFVADDFEVGQIETAGFVPVLV